MSLRVVTPFLNTNIPGAYVNYTVQSTPVGIASSGNIVIFGEADGGDSYKNVVLSGNFFTPDQLDKVQQAYISGQIVDAFRALTSPSADADIQGTATRIYIAKTNSGVKASAIIDTDYGTLSDLNWGTMGNQDKYQILSNQAEVAPVVTGVVISAFGAPLNGTTFKIRLNGAAATTVTLSATASDHDTIGHLVTELNALLPAGVVASPGTVPNNLVLTVAADSVAYRKGWGKSLELFDSTPGDLAALGLVAGLTASSEEPAVELQDSNALSGISEILAASADVALEVGYLGTTGTLTIASGMLTTTVVGGSGSNLSVDLSQYSTIGVLAAYIAAQPGYSASVVASANQLSPSKLDAVAAIGIASSGAGLEPGRIKRAASNWQIAMSTSRIVSFSPTALAGLPNPMASASFLSGGARGATLAADIVAVVDSLATIQANIVVPLISQDASLDIADGQTDPSSTYTINAVNALVKSHCLEFSTPALKRNRIAILSHNGLFAAAASAAQSLATFRCSLAFQQIQQVNSAGSVVQFQPWYGACVAAGMQAGGFYKSITNKFANIISFSDPSDFDSGSPGDVSEALDAGLLILMKDTAGSRWISDQTTYGFDNNFVYNAIQAVYDADIIALDLASSFQNAFVGKSLADVSAASAAAFLTQRMQNYMQLKLIAPSDDAPLGFKNPKIVINAPVMSVAVEIKLATALYFIPINFSISAVQQSAG